MRNERETAAGEHRLVMTVDPEHVPSLARALTSLGIQATESSSVVLAFAPSMASGGVPVHFDAVVALPSEAGEVGFTLRGIGDPEKAGSCSRLVEASLVVPRSRLEPARAFMSRLMAAFTEERRLECRGADHFLGSPPEVAWRKRAWRTWQIVAMHRAIDALLEGWTRVRTTSPRGKEPVRQRFIDEEGTRLSLYTEVRYFLRRGSAWMVLDVGQIGNTNGQFIEVSVAAVGLDGDELDRFHDRIAELVEKAPTSRRRMTAHGEELKLDREYSWDELFLEPRVRDELRREVERFFEQGDLYAKMQLPHRRGLLLHGAPGTGKTLYGKILASTVRDAAFIWVTAVDVSSGALSVKEIFERARGCHRAILFFEDLDFYASQRAGSGRDETLGELLVQLDGMHSNAGLLVIATTNDLNAIEPALRDRPSRFDRTIEVGPAPEEMRVAHLLRLLESFGVDRELLRSVGPATEGMTGAQIQELAFVARRQALDRGTDRISAADLDRAVASARQFKVKALGFTSPPRRRGPFFSPEDDA